MATHSNKLTWKISWTEEEPGELHSPWGHKGSDMTQQLNRKSRGLGESGSLKSSVYSFGLGHYHLIPRTLES